MKTLKKLFKEVSNEEKTRKQTKVKIEKLSLKTKKKNNVKTKIIKIKKSCKEALSDKVQKTNYGYN